MTTKGAFWGLRAGKEDESVLYIIVVCSQIIPRTLMYLDELADALLNLARDEFKIITKSSKMPWRPQNKRGNNLPMPPTPKDAGLQHSSSLIQ